MFWHKEAAPVEQEPTVIDNRQEFRIVEAWDFKNAVYFYILQSRFIDTFSDGSTDVRISYKRDKDGWYDHAKGNKSWALKNAKHFSVEITYMKNKKRGRPLGSKNKVTKKGKK